MQSSMSIPRKEILDELGIKVVPIELSEEPDRTRKTREIYDTLYHRITAEEIKELPTGTLTEPIKRAVYRILPGCKGDEHIQLIHYPQPILDNRTTFQYLRAIKDCGEGKNASYLPFKDYVTANYQQLYEYFPFAIQVAYDIHTTGTISDRSIELEKRIAERYSNIRQSLSG